MASLFNIPGLDACIATLDVLESRLRSQVINDMQAAVKATSASKWLREQALQIGGSGSRSTHSSPPPRLREGCRREVRS
jgi:hypothetical protein